MELSDVLNKFARRENPNKEYFWALEVWDSGVKSAIWTIENEKVVAVALGSHEIWEGKTDDLVNAADQSLSIASERFLEEGQEPSKVIFGLPYNWLEGDKILPDHQEKLQAICEKLELSPVGFVLTVDALAHHLKDTEGIPPSAIVINPQKNRVLVSIFERGKVEGVELVERSENLGDDVYEGLVRFKDKETLPSRMLLFDGEDMESARQILVDFPWQQKLPFLHLPKIEILPLDFDIISICLAGGSEVARSLGFKVTKEEKATDTPAEIEPVVAVGAAEGTEQSADALKEMEEKQEEQADLVEAGEVVELAEPEEAGETAEILEEDFGFVEGEDVNEKQENNGEQGDQGKQEEQENQGKRVIEVVETDEMEEMERKRKLGLPKFSLPVLKIPHFSFPHLALPGRTPFLLIIILIAVLLLGGGGGFLFLWYVPRADVILTVSPQTTQKDFELTVDPNQETADESNLILPGKLIEQDVSGDKTDTTTGQKLVGDKAKGELTIFNTGVSRHFPSGTALTGPGGLKFTLDQDTDVASGSAVNREEVKVPVTASDIGADYNLAADSQFSIGTLDKSIIGAKNGAALSGGTSRQIQAVSDADQKGLVSSLTQSLTDKVKAQLLASVSPEQKIIDESLTTKEVGRNFNAKVGDEAQSLTLNLKIKASVLVFSQDEFMNLVKKQIAGSVPVGYEVKNDGVQTDFKVKKQEKDGSVRFQTSVSVRLLPKLDVNEIVHNLVGKYPNIAHDYLSGLPGVVDNQIIIRPSLPAKIMTLPRLEKNISLDIRSQ
ncbi:MAG: hypothetical protein U1C56_00100 [Candidatus Curtissbacteria bacterium]|nr:hypothetical protein [Candidatus Curtissbacteria bacterium]